MIKMGNPVNSPHQVMNQVVLERVHWKGRRGARLFATQVCLWSLFGVLGMEGVRA
jgi:hypothetical protein